MPEAILVTGSAGFIGFHVARCLLEQGHEIVGVDNVNDYYDTSLKENRLAILLQYPTFRFERADLSDSARMMKIFNQERFPFVIHLAAQAGVRHSLTNPHAYAHSNLLGFLNILEGCRHNGCAHLLYASSSSVYGANTKLPFRTSDAVDHPISLYAATKRANELMAHTYAHLFALPCTGLRFFTVYGPWGRPDMAMWCFTKAIIEGQPIKLYNGGHMLRDFTYVDDVAEAIARLLWRPPQQDPAWSGDKPACDSSSAPWRIYNIGNSNPVKVMDVVNCIEAAVQKSAIKQFEPMQPGDVPATFADVQALAEKVNFQPRTAIETGIERFVAWYREYHQV